MSRLKQYLEAGQVVGTHGVRGEMRVQPWCDSPEVFATLKTLYLTDTGEQPLVVKSRPHKRIAIMKVKGIDTLEQAAAHRGAILYLNRDDLPLEEGAYFIADLIGLSVLDADTGQPYGVITDVSHTGANDVYHMEMDGREVLIPAIPLVVKQVNVVDGYMKIHPLKGLFDL